MSRRLQASRAMPTACSEPVVTKTEGSTLCDVFGEGLVGECRRKGPPEHGYSAGKLVTVICPLWKIEAWEMMVLCGLTDCCAIPSSSAAEVVIMSATEGLSGATSP